MRELVLSFYSAGPRSPTQVTRLVSKRLFLPQHLKGPRVAVPDLEVFFRRELVLPASQIIAKKR